MNQKLLSLIDDYFSITGRPVSTMTVNEYFEFMEKSSIEIPVTSNDMSEMTENNSILPSYKGTPIVQNVNQISHSESDQQKNKTIQSSSSSLKIVTNNYENKNNSRLEMLKRIKG